MSDECGHGFTNCKVCNAEQIAALTKRAEDAKMRVVKSRADCVDLLKKCDQLRSDLAARDAELARLREGGMAMVQLIRELLDTSDGSAVVPASWETHAEWAADQFADQALSSGSKQGTPMRQANIVDDSGEGGEVCNMCGRLDGYYGYRFCPYCAKPIKEEE